SAPTGRTTRSLNFGSRYFSKRSGGSMICMSQSTNLSPSFMLPSNHAWGMRFHASCSSRGWCPVARQLQSLPLPLVPIKCYCLTRTPAGGHQQEISKENTRFTISSILPYIGKQFYYAKPKSQQI